MSLFDHLNQITQKKKRDYWESLSEQEQKQFNVFMINRYLSMNFAWVDFINDLQKYTLSVLPPKLVYKLYEELIPKERVYLKYVKGKSEKKYESNLIQTLCKHFECGTHTAKEYAFEMYKTDEGKHEMRHILEMYGTEEKLIKKCKL